MLDDVPAEICTSTKKYDAPAEVPSVRCLRKVSRASFNNMLMFVYRAAIARAGVLSAIKQSLFVGNLVVGSDVFCTTKMSPNVLPLVLGASSL